MTRTGSVLASVFTSCLAFTLTTSLNAQVILRVDGEMGQPTPVGNGETWPTAFLFLQDGISQAIIELQVPGVTVQLWVKATHPILTPPYLPDRDTANPTGNGDRARSFELRAAVELYGGFAGGETQLDQRDPVLNVTVLSGDIDGDGLLDNDNSFHVVFADTDAGTTARLDGFTITAGNANGSANNERGGGMLLLANVASMPVNPTVARCTFVENLATLGGGLANGFSGSAFNADPTLVNCAFIDNTASNDGGALYNDANQPLLVNCLFAGNVAQTGNGGAIFDTGNGFAGSSNPTLVNCTLSDNFAVNGGGIFDTTQFGQATMTNSIVWGNSPNQIVDEDGVGTTVDFSDVQDGFVGGTGNIDAPPLFVNAPAGDYRLSPGSPANDVGSNVAVPADSADLDGDNDPIEQTPLDLGLRPRFAVDATPVAPSFCDPVPVDMGAFENADCDGNALLDEDEIAENSNLDMNGDGILDLCQDCDANGMIDPDEIAANPSLDCNLNGRLDLCDVTNGCSPDGNANLIPDDCECALDIVFVIDTSVSMQDPGELAAICQMIDNVSLALSSLPFLRVTSFRIGGADPGAPGAPCTALSVTDEIAPNESSGTCDSDLGRESWGSATEVVAELFTWTPFLGMKRIIVPIGDESACLGTIPIGIFCDADDDLAIDAAVAACLANQCFAFPIAGVFTAGFPELAECVVANFNALATPTGGQVYEAGSIADYTGVIADQLAADLLALVSACPTDVNGDGVTNVLDLINLLLCFGLPAVPGCEAEDVNGDGTVDVLDLIPLLLQFGVVCPCAPPPPPPPQQSLEEDLRGAGLTMDDWDDFMDVMQNGTQEEKENWHCWMTHYLQGCPISTGQFCGGPNCPDDDPFEKH